MCHVARGAPGVWRDWTLKSELAKGKLNWASHHQLLQAASLDRGEEPSWGEGDEDGNDQRLLLPPALRAAAPPPARPAAAAAAAANRSGRATATAELAGCGGGGDRRWAVREGGHGRRVLPDLRHKAHHALRRCVQPLQRRRPVRPGAWPQQKHQVYPVAERIREEAPSEVRESPWWHLECGSCREGQVLHQVWSSAEDNGVSQPAFSSASHLPQLCPSVPEGLRVRQCCRQPVRSVWSLGVRVMWDIVKCQSQPIDTLLIHHIVGVCNQT